VEEYQQKLGLIQKKLEEVVRDYVKQETKLREKDQRMEELEMQKRDYMQQLRKMINLFG
jgi:uncharacterized protein YaaN involved in tellurite resistance